MYELEDISIKGIRAEFGDAALTLYKVFIPEGQLQRDHRLEHRHFQYELHFMVSGQGSFLIQGKEIPLHEGEVFVIPPEVTHSPFQKTEKDMNVVFNISLDKIQGEEGPYNYFLSTLEGIACTPVPLPSALLKQIPLLYEEFGCSSLRGMLQQKAAVYDIIVRFFEHINGFQTVAASSPHPGKEDEKLMMLENLVNNNLPIRVIAEKMGYSVRHTGRLIRRSFGKSLGEIQKDAKVASAKRLLREETLSVDTVAAKSGFSGADSLRRAFRRYEGKTPSDFRKGENDSISKNTSDSTDSTEGKEGQDHEP